MYGRINFSQIFFTTISIMTFTIIFIYFMGVNGTITIERPYHNEYMQCQEKLGVCEQSKIPSCSPCEPIKDKGYWFFYILGFLVYAGTLTYMYWRINLLDKREEEIRKREHHAK